MIIPKEVRAQRLSVSLGAPRPGLVFDIFLFFFFQGRTGGKEQMLVYHCTWCVICIIIRVCSGRGFLIERSEFLIAT